MINEAVEERKRLKALTTVDGKDRVAEGSDEDRRWDDGEAERQVEDGSEEADGNQLDAEGWEKGADDLLLLFKAQQEKLLGVAEAGMMVTARQATANSRAKESTSESETASKGLMGSEGANCRVNVVREVGAVDERAGARGNAAAVTAAAGQVRPSSTRAM